MTLPELSIRRHVLAVMLSAVIVLFGVIAMRDVGVDRVPNIDLPVISVTVLQQGADAEIIDNSVTEVVERAVNTVPGIDDVQSISVPGASIVTVVFNLNKDIDVAFTEVQARVSQAVQDLPEEAEAPVIERVEFDAQPILWLSLTGDWTLQDINLYALNIIRPQIENVDGVGEVQLGGGLERTIRVEIDPGRMAAYDVTAQDLLEALENEHIQMPGGFLIGGAREDQIQLDLEYHNPVALEDLLIAEREGALIHLRDIAEVVDGLEDRRSFARFNGHETVGLGIVKVSGANTVAIAEAVQQRIEERITPQLPPGISLDVAYDESRFILDQVDALYFTIFLGVILAALVIWLFLKNLRSTLIVSLSIPISLMAALAVIYFFGYTLNSITMLALLLLIGVVVDDAIVVLENIYRHREEEGEGRMEGAINGSNEVFFAVVATSLALMSIFASVLFLDAIIGRFFESFAVVVTVGVAASSLVALTLVPMLCSRFMVVRDKQDHGRVYNVLEGGFRRMERGYRWALGKALAARWIVLAITAAFVVLAGSLFTRIDGEFVPEEDVGQFLISFSAPLGSSIDYTESRLERIEAVLDGHSEVASYFTAVALGDQGQVNSGIAFVTLTDRDERDLRQQDLMRRVQAELSVIPGVQAFASDVPLVGGERGEPLQFNVTGPDLYQVAAVSQVLQDRLQEVEGLGFVDLDLDMELPQLALEIDRDRANALGLRAADIATSANMMIGGMDVGRYNDEPGDGRRYDLRVKARDGTFEGPEDLNKIYLRTAEGEMVPISAVAGFREEVGPAQVSRFNLEYAAPFYVNPEIGLQQAIGEVQRVADEVLPLGYSVQFTGEAQELEETAEAIVFVLFLAVALVYMVLASQFNSLLQPLYIMAAQPVALVGGVLGLWIGGYSVNIYSMIGLVLLMGLVTKNGILLVDLTNQYRELRKLGVNEALTAACPTRLRPVLMTSLTLILAMIPAILGLGAGSDTTAPMAAAIIGGMITSMVLTLVAIPAAYSLVETPLERRRKRREERQREERSERAPPEPRPSET